MFRGGTVIQYERLTHEWRWGKILETSPSGNRLAARLKESLNCITVKRPLTLYLFLHREPTERTEYAGAYDEYNIENQIGVFERRQMIHSG